MAKKSSKKNVTVKATKSSKRAVEAVKKGKDLVIEAPSLDLTSKSADKNAGKKKDKAKSTNPAASAGAPEMVEDETTNQVQETEAPAEAEVESASEGDVDHSHPDFKVSGMTDALHLLLQRSRAQQGLTVGEVSAAPTEQPTTIEMVEAEMEAEETGAKLSKKERKAAEKAAKAQSQAAVNATLTLTHNPTDEEAPTTASLKGAPDISHTQPETADPAPTTATAGRKPPTTQLQRELPGALKQANKRKEPQEIVLDRKYRSKFNGVRMVKELATQGIVASATEEFIPEDNAYIVTVTVYPKGTKAADVPATTR